MCVKLSSDHTLTNGVLCFCREREEEGWGSPAVCPLGDGSRERREIYRKRAGYADREGEGFDRTAQDSMKIRSGRGSANHPLTALI